MVRAIAYIRVSTDRQVRDGTSLVTQRRRVQEYSASKRYDLVQQFVEEGESAKTDKRPVLQEMLRYCKEQRGKIDVLIFPKIDRLARYSADYHYLKSYLREQGVRVESTDERFDDSPSGRFLESLLAATAQFDNDVRSERAYNGMREAVAEGRWVFGAPRGFRNVTLGNKSTIEPDPETRPTIVCAFEQTACMTPIREILEWLLSQGISMSRSTFHRMIHNKAYIGEIEAFGETHLAVPPFIPLVSQRLFRAAQDAIKRRRHPKVYQRDNLAFPLRGTVRCMCGQFLTAGWSRGRSDRYAYYRCRVCTRVNFRGEMLEEQFVATLSRLRRKIVFDERMVVRLKAQWDKDMAAETGRSVRVRRDINKLESLQRVLISKVAEGVVPDYLAKEQFSEIDSKLRNLKGDLAPVVRTDASFGILIGHGKSLFRQIDQLWLNSDLRIRQRLQRTLFPQGATIVKNSDCRTAKGDPTPGSDDPFRAQLSHLALPADKSANAKSFDAPNMALPADKSANAKSFDAPNMALPPDKSANRSKRNLRIDLDDVVPGDPRGFIEFLSRLQFELGDIVETSSSQGDDMPKDLFIR